MLLHTFPATETTTTNPPLASGYALTPHKWENSPVHTNSYALIVADLTLTDTTIETLRALRAGAHRTNAYGPDCDEGDGCDADLEEKLIRCVRRFDYLWMYAFFNPWVSRLLHTYVSGTRGMADRSMLRRKKSLLDARQGTPGKGKLGIGVDELRELNNALA